MKREFTHSELDDNKSEDNRPSKRPKTDKYSQVPEYQGCYKQIHGGTEPESPLHTGTDLGFLDGRTATIVQWIKQCGSRDEPDMPQTPSSTTSTGTRRRTVKQLQRRRPQSPVKNLGSVQYRAINMADANVFVDHFPEAPSEIQSRLNRVFGESSWHPDQQDLLKVLAEHYCSESRVLARNCAGENEWRSNLFLGLLQRLARLDAGTLMLSASDKPWLTTLKPTAPSSSELISSDVALATPALQQPRPVVPVSPNTSTFSAPSVIASDIFSETPNGLLTPKPDITLGLAHTSFTPVQKRVLRLLQDDGRVLSEPHQAQIGLQFPFLIVETKGGSAGGNMIGAQNQAAIDGACIINILGDLQNVVTRITSMSNHMQQPTTGDNQDGRRSICNIAFSVTTEGPLHEVWVHYQLEDTYHMTCHRAWRTTRREDAGDFVQCLAKIVRWGCEDFRESLLSLLERIERPILGGILTTWGEDA